jgi:integrase
MKAATAGTREMVWDANLPGFGVRVTDKGSATFLVMRRIRGQATPKRFPVGGFAVGKYPEASELPEGHKLPLAAARERAREVIALLDNGIDPDAAEEERRRKEEEQRLAEVRQRENTFATVAEEFIAGPVSKWKSGAEVAAAIRRELISQWGERQLKDVTRRDVVSLLEKVAKDHPYVAHNLLGYVRQVYDWAIERDLYGIDTSPCDRIKAAKIIGEKQPRKRILNDSELRVVWQATGEMGYPFGPFIRMLLLTGQRLREVAEMSWGEVEFDKALLTIPAARMKGDEAHEVPLSPAAKELLEALPRFAAGSFLFTTTSGERPVSGFSKAKVRLDALVLAALRKAAADRGDDPSEVKAPPRWTFHDLRRTMRTHLGGLPVPSDVAEMVIAHKQGGVRGVYDLHGYRDEKRRALELWAARLKDIVEPAPGGNVIAFAGAKS